MKGQNALASSSMDTLSLAHKAEQWLTQIYLLAQHFEVDQQEGLSLIIRATSVSELGDSNARSSKPNCATAGIPLTNTVS